MNNNLSIVRQQFAQCEFNHKIHEKAHDRLMKCQSRIKYVNVILMGIVIFAIILQTKYPNNSIFGGISIAIAVFEICFIFFQKEFSFEGRAKEHKKIALQYLGLRDKYKNFIVDIIDDGDNSVIAYKRDFFQDQYQIINSLSLDTNYQDYQKAQLQLLGTNNTDEEFTRSEEEINRFLPKSLHFQ